MIRNVSAESKQIYFKNDYQKLFKLYNIYLFVHFHGHSLRFVIILRVQILFLETAIIRGFEQERKNKGIVPVFIEYY